jgi:ubiquinone/menaquinone biosynthesis C-methylase UbiE
MAVFDSAAADRLNDAYRSVDVVERRMANFLLLDPAWRETILDLGCGPGFLSEELARAVGDHGRVVALDPSEPMREAAAERLADFSNVEIVDGAASHIPVADASLDGVVAVQVMEYVKDLGASLDEIRRVLKPGGRVVVGDIHYDSCIWYSRDPARMRRFLDAQTRHVFDKRLAEHLADDLVDHGFVVERREPLVMMTTRPRADSFPLIMARMSRKSAISHGGFDEAEVEAFFAEQDELAARGAFFFATTHFVTRARKP